LMYSRIRVGIPTTPASYAAMPRRWQKA
jgi:hypothetical protein